MKKAYEYFANKHFKSPSLAQVAQKKGSQETVGTSESASGTSLKSGKAFEKQAAP